MTVMSLRTRRCQQSILKLSQILLCATIGLTASISDARSAGTVDGRICEKFLASVSKSEGVPLGVLYAVGMTETGTRGILQPYALNIEGKSVITESSGGAMKEFRVARRRGKILVDLGCMQVNHHYHGMNFASPDEMLDPEKKYHLRGEAAEITLRQEGRLGSCCGALPREPAKAQAATCLYLRSHRQFGAQWLWALDS